MHYIQKALYVTWVIQNLAMFAYMKETVTFDILITQFMVYLFIYCVYRY